MKVAANFNIFHFVVYYFNFLGTIIINLPTSTTGLKVYFLQVFFSDESTISILDDSVQTVRRRKGEEFDPQCLKKTVKFPQKIMIWGDISVHGTSRLHIVSGTMNAQKYISVLQTRLLPQIKDWQCESDWIFQPDGAPCHTAKAVKSWIAKNNMQVLPWAEN